MKMPLDPQAMKAAEDAAWADRGCDERHLALVAVRAYLAALGPAPLEEEPPRLYQKCPVCDGQGLVSKPPYLAGDQATWSSSSTAPYPCKRCVGTGTIPTPTPHGTPASGDAGRLAHKGLRSAFTAGWNAGVLARNKAPSIVAVDVPTEGKIAAMIEEQLRPCEHEEADGFCRKCGEALRALPQGKQGAP